MPTKRKPRPIEPSLISIRRCGETISVMSRLDEKNRLFVMCPRCEKDIQLSRYGHPGNFDGHYKSMACNDTLRKKQRKQIREILINKFGPMYDPKYRQQLLDEEYGDISMFPSIRAAMGLTGVQARTQFQQRGRK